MRLALDNYAFPDGDGSAGMTLRDYFAGQALASAVALVGNDASMRGQGNDALHHFAAQIAYQAADAMLAERERNNP